MDILVYVMLYINHLNTEYLDTPFTWIRDSMGVWYSNGKVTWLSDHHSNTRSFDNQTQIYHLNTRQVRIQMVTVCCLCQVKTLGCFTDSLLSQSFGQNAKIDRISIVTQLPLFTKREKKEITNCDISSRGGLEVELWTDNIVFIWSR